MAKFSGAARLAMHGVVLFMSCVGALGLRPLSSPLRNSSSKAKLDNYRDYAAGVVIFGDSTVDVGVNNYLHTIIKSNFQPYGRLFEARTPTGRFCDGKLSIDFIVEKIGYPLPLPYLAPNAHGQAILTGINFASSASGWYDNTAVRFNVKGLGEQLAWYKNWKNEVVSLVGQEKGEFIIKNSLCLISTGANDWVNNYYLNPILMNQYTPEEFTTVLVGTARSYIQELFDLGGHNIAVLGLPPLGCLPSQITLHGKGQPSCIEWLNVVALRFNEKFADMINNDLKPNFHGGRLVYLDLYTPLDNIVKNPQAYGISETRNGCCGTGKVETGTLCEFAMGTCQNASPYLWWDIFHPTEHTNTFLADDLFNQAEPILVGPVLP